VIVDVTGFVACDGVADRVPPPSGLVLAGVRMPAACSAQASRHAAGAQPGDMLKESGRPEPLGVR
jgi:hypothetical protein